MHSWAVFNNSWLEGVCLGTIEWKRLGKVKCLFFILFFSDLMIKSGSGAITMVRAVLIMFD